VTFADFARLAHRNGWTVEELAREFRGLFDGSPGDPGYESPRAYLKRVLSGDPSWESVIPFRPIVDKYVRAKRYSTIGDHIRRCECGCGRPVWHRKRAATDACRKRLQRARDRDRKRRHGTVHNGEHRSANTEVFP
jgi:hypothetical protein